MRNFLLALVGSTLALAVGVPAAHATYPGTNGETVAVCGDAVCTLSPDGRVRTLLTGGRRLTYDPSFSADGRTIVFTRADRIGTRRGYELFRVGADGTGLARITRESQPAANYSPQMTPDGERIVYADGDDGVIASVDASGGDRQQITEGFAPKISPDGGQIAFLRVEQGSARQLWVANIDGTDSHRVTPNEGTSFDNQTWAPDGETIAFEAPSGIYTVRPDGSDLQRIDIPAPRPSNPVYSPDGEKLAFSRFAGLENRCYRVEVGRLCDRVLQTYDLMSGELSSWIGNGSAWDWGPATGEPAPVGRCRGEEATITGTDLPDVVRGTDARDVIDAGAGDDTLYGFDGEDVLCGGEGDDEMFGGEGVDDCRGGRGANRSRTCDRNL